MALIDRLRAAFTAFSSQQVETTETGAQRKDPNQGGTPWPGMGSMGDWYFGRIKVEQGRMARYRDYETMDQESGEIQAVLDLVTDEATQADRVPNDAFTVESDDERAKEFLMELFRDKLGLVADAWPLARDVAKFGDEFAEIVVNAQKSVVRFK